MNSDVRGFLKRFDAVQKRTAKSNLMLGPQRKKVIKMGKTRKKKKMRGY